MNRIGIIGAMDEEVSQIKDKMESIKVLKKANMEFYSGKLMGKDVVVVRSGIGKVNAAVCTQILIDDYQVAAVINTGIAGSLKAEINIGDMVLSTDALQHDVDATNFGYEYGVIPRMETSIYEADKTLLKKAEEICKKVNSDIGVHLGRVVSGDQFIGDKHKKNWISEHFSGYCTEMEGAAIAQTAYLNNVPFLVIRAISDKADDSAHVDYDVFEAQAITHAVNLITALIPEI
jgi:adenosylhomocysteine nucleosidase